MAAQVDIAFYISAAHEIAVARVYFDISVQILQPHTRIGAAEVHIAGDTRYVEIACISSRLDTGALGHRKIQVSGDTRARTRTILIASDDHGVSLDYDIDRRVRIQAI